MTADPGTAVAAADTALDLWKIVIPALAALLGVVIGGVLQIVSAFWVAETQRSHRLKDEKAARGRDEDKLEADQKYVRAVLARHLEAYARTCAHAMWDNDDHEGKTAINPPAFPPWPLEVSWELLGANEMVAIRDIEVRADIERSHAEGSAWYGASDNDDVRSYYKDGAARIGLDAWTQSKRLRIKAGVDPFEFPSVGGNFAESLADHVERLDEQARLYEKKRAAKKAEGKDDLDD